MPPQVAINDADAETLLRAILGLADGISETKATLTGKITLAPAPDSVQPGGGWEFSAEAPGFTAVRFRMPAK